MHADPGRGELLSAEHHFDEDDTEMLDDDEEEDFDEKGDETLTDLIKDP